MSIGYALALCGVLLVVGMLTIPLWFGLLEMAWDKQEALIARLRRRGDK